MNGRRPPVNEVVLAVSVGQQDLLGGPRLAEVLGEWFQTYPEAQSVPPYDMPVEHPVSQSAPITSLPGLELLKGMPKPRFWLTSAAEPFLIQVQPDYLALNWRRRDTTAPYVHYATIKEKFISFLDTVAAGLHARGATLVPTRAELTYVNVIEPNELWHGLGDVHRLFALDFPESGDYEQLTFGYTKPIRVAGDWRGRLHVNLQSGHDVLKDEARLLLNITARSGSLIQSSESAALEFLDQAHQDTNRSFLSLLRPQARDIWRLSEENQ